MSSLRRRFQWATGALVALQLSATALVALAWRGALAATARERDIAAWRVEVDALGTALREQYVHEAHTYIEGGTGHLDHGATAEGVLNERLARVRGLPLPKAAAEPLRDLERAVQAGRDHFHERAVPLAELGALDRGSAAILHAQTEVLAADAARACNEIDALLQERQAAEGLAVERASRRAIGASAALTLGALALAAWLARGLAQRVLRPIAALRAAAESFGGGERVMAPEGGDDELAALGQSFNAMTARVREAEDRRLEAERLAALGEMSAAVAHELMSPLTVILGHPEARRLEPVRAEAEHATRVVRSLLGFARPVGEPAEPVELAQLLREAAARATLFAEEARVEVQAAPCTLALPPSAARQVLDNLTRNALAASPPGATVELALLPGPVIEVRDRGPGVPAALRPRLYTPFAGARQGGTGLGLAVSQSIARATGGLIEHIERPGGGTIARWRLRV